MVQASKCGRLNHRSVFKKRGCFLKRFLTAKIPSKPTELSPQNSFVIYLKFSYWTDLQLPIQLLISNTNGRQSSVLTIPMLQASNLGRGLSPVSGVVVAVSDMGKISPFEIVKRMSVPMLVGFICVIIGTEIFVSVAV